MSFRIGCLLASLSVAFASFCVGCAADEGPRRLDSGEMMVVGGCNPKGFEGELLGTARLGGNLLISVKDADGEAFDFLVSERSGAQERLEKAPEGTRVEFVYFPDEQDSIPVVNSITVYDS